MKFTLFFILTIFVALKEATSATDQKQLIQAEWETFKAEFGKTYTSKLEEKFRMKIYMENRLKIAKHNRDPSSSYKLKINQFGDLLSHEGNEIMFGPKRALQNLTATSGSTFLPPENFLPPPQVDWRDHGFVTPVGDQGKCNAGWAFAATGALEGQMKRKTGKLVSLSKQNLLDCSHEDDTYDNTCLWGYATLAYRDIRRNKGIDSESSYPYEGVVKTCRYSESNKAASVTWFKDVKFFSELHLKIAVASVGPIAAFIDASREAFRFYESGIYKDDACSSDPDNANHHVLVVGYGTENGQDYWLLKNSWGTKWGDKGYMKMARNNEDQCGIATLASYPIV